MRKLLFLVFIICLTPKSWAILGGEKVNDNLLKQKIIMFDTRVNDISIVCSGSFISKNKLITAAHCFDHLKETSCLEQGQCKNQKVIINGNKYNFKVSVHPKYKSKKLAIKYQNSSNHDLAVLELPNLNSTSFFEVNTSKVYKAKPLIFYGYGMTELKKKNIASHVHYEELGRGELFKGRLQNPNFKNGLVMNAQSKIKLDKNNTAISLASSQVLRSDSGGPLVVGNEIVAVVRNYQLSDIVSNSSQGVQRGLAEAALKMQSTFTTLDDLSTQEFLKAHR